MLYTQPCQIESTSPKKDPFRKKNVNCQEEATQSNSFKSYASNMECSTFINIFSQRERQSERERERERQRERDWSKVIGIPYFVHLSKGLGNHNLVDYHLGFAKHSIVIRSSHPRNHKNWDLVHGHDLPTKSELQGNFTPSHQANSWGVILGCQPRPQMKAAGVEGDRSFSHESWGSSTWAPVDFVEDMMIHVIFRNISRVHTIHTHRLIYLNFCPLVVSSKMSRCLVWQFSFTSDFIHISWQASWHTNLQCWDFRSLRSLNRKKRPRIISTYCWWFRNPKPPPTWGV